MKNFNPVQIALKVLFTTTILSFPANAQIPQHTLAILESQPNYLDPPSTSQNSPPKSDTELYLGYYRECLDRIMYRILNASDKATALNGYNMGYKYGEKPSDLSNAQMESVGLRWEWTFQSWIGSQPQTKIPIMKSAEASQQCKTELDNIRR